MEFADKAFKITMSNMLRKIEGKIVKIDENMENIWNPTKNYSIWKESNGHPRTVKQYTNKTLDIIEDTVISKTV